MPQNHQELIPVRKGESNAAWLLCHRANRVQDLPYPNVDDPVAFWVHQHQNRRRHRNRNTSQCQQRVETPTLISCCKGALRRAADPSRAVALDVSESARGLPAVHLFEVGRREVAANAGRTQYADESDRCVVLGFGWTLSSSLPLASQNTLVHQDGANE